MFGKPKKSPYVDLVNAFANWDKANAYKSRSSHPAFEIAAGLARREDIPSHRVAAEAISIYNKIVEGINQSEKKEGVFPLDEADKHVSEYDSLKEE